MHQLTCKENWSKILWQGVCCFSFMKIRCGFGVSKLWLITSRPMRSIGVSFLHNVPSTPSNEPTKFGCNLYNSLRFGEKRCKNAIFYLQNGLHFSRSRSFEFLFRNKVLLTTVSRFIEITIECKNVIFLKFKISQRHGY